MSDTGPRPSAEVLREELAEIEAMQSQSKGLNDAASVLMRASLATRAERIHAALDRLADPFLEVTGGESS